jgi:hypothetical protein
MVLLTGEMYEVCSQDVLRWHDMQTKFDDGCFWHSIIIKVMTISEAAVFVLLMGGIYDMLFRWHQIA